MTEPKDWQPRTRYEMGDTTAVPITPDEIRLALDAKDARIAELEIQLSEVKDELARLLSLTEFQRKLRTAERRGEQAAFEMAANLVDYNGNAKLNRWASDMIRKLAKERAK